MRSFAKTIDAGASIELREKGSFFKLTDCNGTLVVQSADQRIRLASVGQGQGFRGVRFNSLVLINESANAITLVAVIGEGDDLELLDAINLAADAQVAETPCLDWVAIETSAGIGLTLTSTPTVVPCPVDTRNLIAKADPANSAVVFACGLPLSAGDAVPLPLGYGATITAFAASGTQTLWLTAFLDE